MIIPTSDKAIVFVRHGVIKVLPYNGAWMLRWRFSTLDGATTWKVCLTDSQSQRDEYITRIRKYAEIIE